MALRITHLTFSSSGGAGTVARRLAQIQNSLGHTARVSSVLSSTLRHEPLKSPRHTVAASIDEFVIRRRSFHAPISLVREGLHHTVANQARDSDILHIHWPHGVLDWEALPVSPSAGLVWTLHDMRPFTGACHYSLGCDGFIAGCGNCPAVRTVWSGKVASQFASQLEAISQLGDRLQFVSPSEWLADTARNSQILRGAPIRVIPNPLPLDSPAPPTKRDLWPDIPEDARVFVAAAAAIDDPVKDIESAVASFIEAVDDNEDVWLLVAGSGKTKQPGHARVRFLGGLGQQEMAALFSRADYLLVTSLAENQPLLISEAQSHGVCVIVRDSTGLSEHTLIDPHALRFKTGDDLAGLLQKVKNTPLTQKRRKEVARAAKRKYDPILVAQQYLDLYSESRG